MSPITHPRRIHDWSNATETFKALTLPLSFPVTPTSDVACVRCYMCGTDLQARDPDMFKPLHIVSMTIRDSAQDSAAAEGDVLDLCKMVNEWFIEVTYCLLFGRASYTNEKWYDKVRRRLLHCVRRWPNLFSTVTWRGCGRRKWSAVKFMVAPSFGSCQESFCESSMARPFEFGLSTRGGHRMRDHQYSVF